jgi:hypothetical protein
MATVVSLADLVGQHVLVTAPNLMVRHPFDPDASGVAFTLDDKSYLAFEDPNDNYRSSLGVLFCFAGDLYQLGGFYPEYVRLPVLASMSAKPGDDILELRDQATGQVVFRIGTANTDDYYPYYVASWTPVGAA